jgi:oligoendopeptidase F
MTAHVSPDTLPVWRLDDLYAGREDPRIDADLDAAASTNAELVTLKGRLVGSRSDPAALGGLLDQGIRLNEAASNALWRVGAFAGLAASTARDDPDWARFESDIRTRSAAIGAESLFFTLEINQLEDAEIEAALTAFPDAGRWRPWLRRVRAFRPHELSADLERILVDRGPAVANWTRLYDETLARMKVRAGRRRLTLPRSAPGHGSKRTAPLRPRPPAPRLTPPCRPTCTTNRRTPRNGTGRRQKLPSARPRRHGRLPSSQTRRSGRTRQTRRRRLPRLLRQVAGQRRFSAAH